MQNESLVDFFYGDPYRNSHIAFTFRTSAHSNTVMHPYTAIRARQMMVQDCHKLSPTDLVIHAAAFNWTFKLRTSLLTPWAISATGIVFEVTLRLVDNLNVLKI